MSVPPGSVSLDLLRVRGLSKTFPGTKALDNVDLTLRSGHITALVGHNGSGKSTMVKVLAGVYTPDQDGGITDGSGNQEWRERIHFIHQDLGLIGELNTIENLDLTSEVSWRQFAPAPRTRERLAATKQIELFGVDFDVRKPVRHLTPAQRSIVAICRALQDWEDDRQVIVLDEPTASLQDREVVTLLDVVRRIAARGAAVLYISHRLDEVQSLADDVVVLRDGNVVASLERGRFDAHSLVDLIAGRHIEPPGRTDRTQVEASDPLLQVNDLHGESVLGVDLAVGAGEILGISGVIGSGIDDLLGLIFGAIPRSRGSICIGDRTLVSRSPNEAIASGFGFVPRDRHRHGVILGMPASENLTLPRLGPLRNRWGAIGRAREGAEVRHWFTRAAIRPTLPERLIDQFSGGNQQKIVLSKWLRNNPRVLLLEEPTQGIDVGAQDAIYQLVERAADAGTAVLVASSDTKELVRLCDRVLVLGHGRVVADLSGSDLTEKELVRFTLTSHTHSSIKDLP